MTYGDATYLEQNVTRMVATKGKGVVCKTVIDFVLKDVTFLPVADVPGYPSKNRLYVPKNALDPAQPTIYEHELDAAGTDASGWRRFVATVASQYMMQKHPWVDCTVSEIKTNSHGWGRDAFYLSLRAIVELTEKTTSGNKLA